MICPIHPCNMWIHFLNQFRLCIDTSISLTFLFFYFYRIFQYITCFFFILFFIIYSSFAAFLVAFFLGFSADSLNTGVPFAFSASLAAFSAAFLASRSAFFASLAACLSASLAAFFASAPPPWLPSSPLPCELACNLA